ncbi:virion morphogenesis family protein [Mucilaginibacter gracilis]|uniref:Virion morphogenesis family protein n=1 Tax=Mucilaginibacter gracilis TaxID=423350 RepID=A0A495J2Z4_9SPHI|nr:phage virion morphogenesis protein [Mucilaginibacter gracilis]RKR83203.1 virion morphogenesis family protein [Mucilaginibacter gracilis]
MDIPETAQFIRLLANVSRAIDRFPNLIAAEAVAFSKERFRQQNWIDNSTEPWKKRKAESWGRKSRKGRGILVDTGRLFRSVRKIIARADLVVIGTDVPYAQMHNDGGRFKFNQHVKAYTRKQNSVEEVSRPGARTARYVKQQTGVVQVRAFTRKMQINMPRRRFMGNSAYLNRRLERLMANEIVKAAQQAA